ncbi:MAG: DNA polymerase III subunit gamma/tau [Clostridia bacterium]|nr:DNA polymerase III subunit gamma/tau [Clostridia bacterium]
MYRVLYRKWRPEKFSDVIGQQHVTTTLRNEIRLGRISHAYLFTGSRGTGKTSCAKILSRAVNCLDSENGEPCGKCANCVGIANGSILDVNEMDAASNNSVNDIRTLLDEVVFTPSDAKYRVYIIDEVHMLSPGAFNALLKTLEEPPSHVVFILATTEINKIPATILSRCQRFDFSRIDVHDMAARLIEISKEENVSLDNDAALLISAVADGAMRDALSILDRCIGLSENINSAVVREATGLAGRDYLFTLTDAVMKNDVPLAINTINDLHKASKSMTLLCEELAEHFRALMLMKTMRDAANNLIIMTSDELEKAKAQSENISLEQTVSCIETLQAARELMFKGGNNKIEFETCMIKLCSPRLSYDMPAIIARLERLERRAASAPVPANNTAAAASEQKDVIPAVSPAPAVPAAVPTSPTAPAVEADQPQKTPAPASGLSKIEMLSARAVLMPEWEDVLETMKDTTKVTATAFKGTIAYTVDNYVLIYSENERVTEYLRRETYRSKIKDALFNATGKRYSLGPYKPPGTKAGAQAKAKSKLDEFIENISNSNIDVSVD